jgi:phosphoglycerate dehydrogenase-like enzyme
VPTPESALIPHGEKPAIVILDEVELTDDQHERLRSVGSVTAYHANPVDREETLARARDADILVVGWTSLDASLLAQLPRLRMISVWATGYDYIDVAVAREQGVVTCNTPAYAGRAVAELTIGLIVGLVRQIVRADHSVRDGKYSWQGFRGTEFPGLTLGLVGLGDIGGTVATIGSCLGMSILAHVRDPEASRATFAGCEFTSLEELLRRSDVVSLHLPLNSATERLIGSVELAAMKSSAYLVNTARAGLVDQQALTDALRAGRIAGAGLDDIFAPDDSLAELPNVILTPHIGFFTEQALGRKGDICVGNVTAYLSGAPVNVVS